MDWEVQDIAMAGMGRLLGGLSSPTCTNTEMCSLLGGGLLQTPLGGMRDI